MISKLAALKEDVAIDVKSVEMNEMGSRKESQFSKKGFLDQFFQDVDVIKGDILYLTQASNKIHELINNIDKPMEQDALPKASAEIESFKEEANRRAHNAKNLLQKIKKENRRLESDTNDRVGEVKIRVNMHSTLVRKYVDVMKEYQSTQIEFKTRVQDTVVRRIKIVNKKATREEIEDSLRKGDGGTDFFRRAILSQGTNSKVTDALRDVVDTYTDALKLEENVKALGELFNDMAFIVEQQGEMLGQIEFQVNSAADYVESGAVELGKANNYRKKMRKKMCFLAICVIILLIIIIAPILASVLGNA